jgi:cobalt-zinc-cadmium efflux system protein
MAHDHHHHAHLMGRKLGIAFFASFGILLALGVGGWLSHSLALLADAGHVVTDIAALGLSWYATRQATRPADTHRTFGFHRTGILAALVNAVALIVIAVFILVAASARIGHPQAVESTIMMGVATLGLVLNLWIGLGLQGGSEHSLNVRSAFLHVMGDAAASGGVILGAIAIHFTGLSVIDPILSVAIALFIAFGAWQVVEESLHILMEGVPRDLEIHSLVADLKAIEGVSGVHDLHVWSLALGVSSLSCHILIADEHRLSSMAIVSRCTHLLADKYQIEHTTIQAEARHCSPDDRNCNLAVHFIEPAHDHCHDNDDHGHAHHHADQEHPHA